MRSHPNNDELDFRDDGFVYLNGVKLHGEYSFAMTQDGSMFGNHAYVSFAAPGGHASENQSQSALCVGTLCARNGKITEITVDTDQNRISRSGVLMFLALLKKKYALDLHQINIVDSVNGFPKNAGEYMESKGYCLPSDIGGFLLKQALEYEKSGCCKECRDCLDVAIRHGSELALLTKAVWLLENDRMFPGLSREERIRQCEDIMVELTCKTTDPRVLVETKQSWLRTLAKAEKMQRTIPDGTDQAAHVPSRKRAHKYSGMFSPRLPHNEPARTSHPKRLKK